MTKQHASASPPSWAKAALTSPADGEDVRQAVLDYVTQHPGAQVAAVIRDRTVGSRKMVENAIKDMLYHKPKQAPQRAAGRYRLARRHAQKHARLRPGDDTAVRDEVTVAESGEHASVTCEFPLVT